MRSTFVLARSALRAAAVALSAIALVGFSAPTHVAAQAGQITGQVTNATTGAPLGEVQVFLEGQNLGALSRADGRFLILNVPVGTYDLTAQRIGFASATQSVSVTAGGTTSVDFTLETQALGLDEIVVTGTAGAASKREMGSTIAQINVGDLPDRPVAVSDMLQASAPGLDAYGGGALGQSKVIRLRGANSALLTSQPLVFVDGVRIRSNSLPDANPPDRRGGRSGNVAVSPLDQINPNDIERIEVIKGAAATTLYGTEAAGGVIQVFTKRGRGGAPIWTAEVGTGTEWIRRYGGQTEAGEYPFAYAGMAEFLCTGMLQCGRYSNTPYTQNYALNVRGGAGDVDYFLSGGFTDQQGLLPNDVGQNYSMRGNFGFRPAEDLQIQWNTSWSLLELAMTAQQNNAQALPLNAWRQERNYFGTGEADTIRVLLDQDIQEDVERFTTGLTLTYTPIERMTNRFILGYDWTEREHRNLRPFGWPQTPDGRLLNNTFQNRVLSLDYVGSYQFDVSEQLASTFSWGGQAIGDDIREIEGFGQNFPGAADPTISSAAERQSFENRQKIWNAGFFLQNVFDLSRKYFLTLGVRVDGNSAFGSGFGLQAYPKASASWVLSDEAFYPEWGEFKFRAAFGQSGRAPGAFDAVRTWQPEGLAGVPAFVPENVGNDNIGPEVTTEFEAGFDATWINNRLSTAFTYYTQTTADALFNVPQLPSNGFSNSQLTNIGEVENKGLEIQVDANVFESDNWGVDLGVAYSTNESKITKLDDPSLETACRRVGYPIISTCNARVANPNEIVTSPSQVQYVEPGDPGYAGTGTNNNQYLWGSNLPQVFISPSLTVRMPFGVVMHARGDYKGDFYMDEQMYAIGRSVRSPICFPYYEDPQNSNAIRTDGIPAIWMARCGSTSRVEGYVWDASFFKLRTVSATIPVDFIMPDRFSNSVLTMSLNNSFLWMKEMPFMDPETNADPPDDPTQAQQGYTFEETIPPGTSFRISLRVSF
jgi:TonB-dependent SusC/RagA subfamily outer membrane receptor